MPVRRTPVWDVREGGGAVVHKNRGNILRVAEKTDPLPGLQSKHYRGVDDGT